MLQGELIRKQLGLGWASEEGFPEEVRQGGEREKGQHVPGTRCPCGETQQTAGAQAWEARCLQTEASLLIFPSVLVLGLSPQFRITRVFILI